jgi:flavorubredoxin
MFPLVREAAASVIDVQKLRFVSFSHFESDECGSINDWLAAAPQAAPLCGPINAMINGDMFDRPAQVIADGALLELGKHKVRWFDTPHLPHAWECGHLFEETTRTLLCGDLFTQGGATHAPVTSDDILGPSEAFRKMMDYFSHAKNARAMLARLAETKPTTLACMHGSAWSGDGARLLNALGESLDS